MPKNNSTIRKHLLKGLCESLPRISRQIFGDMVGVTERSIRRACSTHVDIRTSPAFKATCNYKHGDDSEFVATLNAFSAFLDVSIPVLSGRDFRVLTYPKRELFAKYICWCGDQKMSQAKFYALLRKERIHASLRGVPCPRCYRYRESPQQLEEHMKMVREQYGCYRMQRQELKDDQIIVVQDFTKLDYVTHNQQDMIVCLLYKEPGLDGVNNNLVVEFINFVGVTGEKNDVLFSMTVWKKFLEPTLYDKYFRNREVLIWSDNGPKHFKCTGYMYFMGMWADVHAKRCQPPRDIQCNFFYPYHGASLADTGASHVKRAIRGYVATHQSSMKDNNEAVACANGITSHSATLVGPFARDKLQPTAVKTFTGITNYFCWSPSGCGQWYAWETTKRKETEDMEQYHIGEPDSFPFVLSQDGMDIVENDPPARPSFE